MNRLREVLHQQFAQALGCATVDEYQIKKKALMEYLRRTRGELFKLEGRRKVAFERMAGMEGITLEEKIEDLALSWYLLQKAFLQTSKEDAIAALMDCGAPAKDLPLLQKIIGDIYSDISDSIPSRRPR